ncbi:E3 SUMO-protein ligase ZBED1 [Ischnura elegans]|uniref:E3 SUMO-protein ligase ZBED1 n=1 Tax=Ischnura elegans TaxID=197161 RepID=UPI001ED89F6B|nr:E3 SUMO-protein ligase ZBED1 [Ischnura elegans]
MFARMLEEKHTFTYKKLVVPMSMRSIYWRYFGFPATDEGDILTKVKIICVLCKTQISYNRNTSNLRMHLQNKHPGELAELEANAPPRRAPSDPKEKRAQKKALKTNAFEGPTHIYTTSADGTVQIDGDIQFYTTGSPSSVNLNNMPNMDGMGNQNLRVFLKSNAHMSDQNVAIILPEENMSTQSQSMVDGKSVSDAIVEFVVLDLQLPDVVEGRGFQRLIATLKSPCEIPSKNKLEEELIPKVYDTFREIVYANVSAAPEIGLSVEEWTSSNGQAYITLAAHYQNQEPELERKVLSTVQCSPNMEAGGWSATFDSLFQEWGVQCERVTAVVAATSREDVLMALEAKNMAVVPCLVHSLQESAAACFQQPIVSAVVAKCRDVITLILQNADLGASLRVQEQMHQLEERALLLDYPKAWASTYVMLERFLEREKILTNFFAGEDIENVTGERFPPNVVLTPEEWAVVRDVVIVLEPFKVTIMTLSEEKTPLISLLKPLLWQLVSTHLKTKDTDSTVARELKEALSESLCTQYSDSEVSLLLQTATTLDPRFKLLPYATEDEKTVVEEHIKKVLVRISSEEEGSRDDEIDSKVRIIIGDSGSSSKAVDVSGGEEPKNKKSRLSGMELLLGDLCSLRSGMPVEERVDLELVQYHSESPAPLDTCPLAWWAGATAKCPRLARVARRYGCVPACVTPPQRIPLEAQVLFDVRRAAISPNTVDKLLFLNANHNV